MSVSDPPLDSHPSHSLKDTSSKTLADVPAQLSVCDGVPTSVSSLAIDRGLLTVPRALPFAGNTIEDYSDGVTDAEIMLRVKTGDESAFAFLVQKYRRQMVGFMYRMCHNPATAEELAQEVFLRVFRSRASYEANAKFNTWLYRIATNLAVNHA